jgi:hybrid cluster-associated redox disulfide protein
MTTKKREGQALATKQEPHQYVTKEMFLGEVVSKHPRAAFVMLQYGLHCIGCHVSVYETIEQGCLGHGMPPDVMEEMLADVNAFIAEEEKLKAGQAAAEPKQ